jgi:hypothetical protein
MIRKGEIKAIKFNALSNELLKIKILLDPKLGDHSPVIFPLARVLVNDTFKPIKRWI